MRIHVQTGFPVCLDDDENGSVRLRERAGAIKTNQAFVYINIYLLDYIYMIYMYINAHACTYRIFHVS